MKRRIFVVSILVFLALFSLKLATTSSSIELNLLNARLDYSFAPQSPGGGSGGGHYVTIGQNHYAWTDFVLMVVMFMGIVISTVSGTFLIHRYYLNKKITNVSLNPYLRITWINLIIFVSTLLLAFVLVFSLWIVLIVGVGMQLLGFMVYWWMNRRQGYPLVNSDLRRAHLVSAGIIAFVLMMFM